LNYKIQATSANDVSVSNLDVMHNGVKSSDYLMASSLSNSRPVKFSSAIDALTGKISVTPRSGNTLFTITRNETPSDPYGENTPSGKLIPGNTGIGISFTAPYNLTVRQENYNQYKSTTGNVGPDTTLSDLLTDWTSYNGSFWEGNTVIASSVSNNFQYKQVDVVPGKVYQLQSNCSIETPNTVSSTYSSTGIPNVSVGDDLTTSNYVYYTPVEFQVSSTRVDWFAPTSNTIFVKIGNGRLNSKLNVSFIELKELVPFDTYDQFQGTIVLEWSGAVANTIIASFNTIDFLDRSITVHSDLNVIINNGSEIVNCSSQSTTNKLAFSYTNTSISASLNGQPVITTPVDLLTRVNSVDFNTSVVKTFSYVPTTNTNLVALST
jgi:hypothetical protein